MKKACLVVSDHLKKNHIFKEAAHRDDCTHSYILLKSLMQERNYDLSTHDLNKVEESEIVIYASNMPKRLPKGSERDKSFLILSESPFIRPDNYDQERHKKFRKIFTWFDKLVDGKKYIKLNYAHKFPLKFDNDVQKKDRLCVLVAGNKKAKAELDAQLKGLDLYKERERVIRWFEANHFDDLDLYGVGWNSYYFEGSKTIRLLNRVPVLPKLTLKLLGGNYPAYKGAIANKRDVMVRYRFSICFENARDIPGYITEKIFDSFFAGCVPIYWGANNITDFIPKTTFIDRRDFSDYESLYKFIKDMSDADYLKILQNIEMFLRSKEADPFKSEFFAQTIVDEIFEKDD